VKPRISVDTCHGFEEAPSILLRASSTVNIQTASSEETSVNIRHT